MRKETTIQCAPGRWTITDAQIAESAIAYSTINSTVHVVKIPEPEQSWEDVKHAGLDFHAPMDDDSFGIWSIRFNNDGRELVAGTSDASIRVADIASGRLVVNVKDAHGDDINAVCFADASGNLLVSGSDDCSLKLWDRRSLGSGKPSGVFLGHCEGITYVSSSNQNSIVSNSKDQTAKIWDYRSMLPANTDVAKVTNNVRRSHFDYRFMPYRSDPRQRHPEDCSIQSLRGHAVLQTLIRVHFLTPNIVYSGSADGKIRYWSTTTGNILHILDCNSFLQAEGPGDIDQDAATALFVRQYLMRAASNRRNQGECVVRDVSVHPFDQTMAASCFSSYPLDPFNEGSTVLFGSSALFGEENSE
jgi:WD repeat-containing protein 23